MWLLLLAGLGGWLLFRLFNELLIHYKAVPVLLRGTVLFVTAHPDDEVMFFAPSILHCKRAGFPVHLLCLSTGNAEGKGEERTKELHRAGKVLGLAPENILVIDHPALQDGMNTVWPPSTIAGLVDVTATKLEADTVISFDSKGVSGHANHRACAAGLKLVAARWQREKISRRALQLESVGLLRKYTFFLESLLLLILSPLAAWRSQEQAQGQQKSLASQGLVRATFRDVLTAWQSLLQHRSQLMWFRYLYALFSRNVFLNTLVEVQPSS
eukprot:m.236229 g.236229  ORF g.236229 m.236229 type:complete len:270 (+) comp20496_c0_seq1:2439-3248(+)